MDFLPCKLIPDMLVELVEGRSGERDLRKEAACLRISSGEAVSWRQIFDIFQPSLDAINQLAIIEHASCHHLESSQRQVNFATIQEFNNSMF